MTLPNQITVSRIFLALLLFLLTLLPHLWSRLFALAVFIVAAFTDWVDGFIARKMGSTSSFGAVVDPIADKILVAAALIAFGIIPELGIPLWAVFLIIVREFFVLGLRMLAALQKKVLVAESWGKLKMSIQSVSVLVILVLINLRSFYRNVPDFFMLLPYYLTLLILVVTWASGLYYLYRHRDILTHSW
ncbi:MAG: CDP-diacylglycerol--glycerol-3-phosphate 3-phosphatidyltransferase [Elusimicrobia bacterium]|nr:CDP-diacylglycerol--glycerol-3-phosphate 3-phosphatidyltransferase [Elusimicrobiota bacterium]